MKVEDKQKANIRNNYEWIMETYKEPLHTDMFMDSNEL